MYNPANPDPKSPKDPPDWNDLVVGTRYQHCGPDLENAADSGLPTSEQQCDGHPGTAHLLSPEKELPRTTSPSFERNRPYIPVSLGPGSLPSPNICPNTNTTPVPSSQNQTQSTTLISENVATSSVTIESQVALNGRRPLLVICPHCTHCVTTSTVESQNEIAEKAANSRYFFICGILFALTSVMSLIVSLRKSFDSDKSILIALAVFVVLVIAGCVKLCREGKNSVCDVTHYCPDCKAKLGVSNGKVEFDRLYR